jgi:hypothetical protein
MNYRKKMEDFTPRLRRVQDEEKQEESEDVTEPVDEEEDDLDVSESILKFIDKNFKQKT